MFTIKLIRKFCTIVLVTFIITFSGMYIAHSHSRSYVDWIVFDNSNENTPIELLNMLYTANEGAKVAGKAINAMGAGVVTNCSNGQAGAYTCKNIDLHAFVPKASMGGGNANTNDIWGWTDPQTGAEIAIVARHTGTSFVDVSNPANPVYKGYLPGRGGGSTMWRDIKTYNNHAFIVADNQPSHGMQIFDLTTLRNVTSGQNLTETAHFAGFGSAHNIVINEDTGFAYAVGSDKCSAGLFTMNISNPTNPQADGCYTGDGYVHDAQCVVYDGPDTTHKNKEICFSYNEDTLTIVNMQNKSNPVQLSRKTYNGVGYTHQGWLTPDHRYAIMNDEKDEQNTGNNTTTYIWDVADLENPIMLGTHIHSTKAMDHNLYIHEGHVYQSNYRAGLRILSTANIANAQLNEVAYFDVIPGSDTSQLSGNWSNYPYFASGTIIFTDIETGLFVAKANLTGGGSSSGGSSSGGSSSGGSSSGGLSNGQSVTGLSAAQNQRTANYYIDVPAGATNLSIKIAAASGSTGDADLFVKKGSIPTDSSYDCRPWDNGSNETCGTGGDTLATSAGRFHINVRAYSTFSNVTLTASYTGGGSSSGGSSSGGSSSGGSSSGGSSSGGSSSGGSSSGGSSSGGLSNGQSVTGLSAAQNQRTANYYIDVPAGATNLSIKIAAASGSTGDADLFVKKGSIPTDSSYDCRPWDSGSNETCGTGGDTLATSAGRFHINVRAYSTFSNVTLTASYTGGGSSSGGSSSGGSSSGGSSSGGSSSGGSSSGGSSSGGSSSGGLSNGQTITGLGAAQNQRTANYYIDVPAGATNLSIKIQAGSGATGDADLFVKKGSIPTDSSYDCRPWIGGNTETCGTGGTALATSAGRFHINLRAYSTFTNVNLTATYQQ